MMWGVALILLSLVRVQVMAREVKMECRKSFRLPPSNSTSPSHLADLKVQLVTVGGDYALNISWAVSIDASIRHLKGTHIMVSGQSAYICEYNPHLADVAGRNQRWFHYLVAVSEGFTRVQAANLPLSPLGSDPSYISQAVMVPPPKESTTTTFPPPTDTQTPRVRYGSKPSETPSSSKPDGAAMTHECVTVIFFGVLAGLMILSACYIIYKSCGANIATSFGFKSLPQSPAVPVHVLLVYPAKNSAFQGAVAALAEFLRHSGCNVAVDMWQQGKIAELGPMRWLAEQVKAADQVLIVCPQVEPSSQPCHSPPNCSLLQPSIPAAAHDLYPLILNMVASHAKSASDLAKFWVVQLGKKQDKRPSNLALELRACKTFCLMKDLSKLCKSLHTHRKDDKKISDLIFRPGISYSEKSTMKLREAVEKHFKRGGTAESGGDVSLNICNENV